LEEHKQVVRRLYAAVVDGQDFGVADELLATDYVVYFPGSAPPLDWEGLKQFIRSFHTAFPDVRHTIEELLADGDRVVARVTARGTHQGTFHGIAPTGRPITVSVIAIYRFVGDTIIEERGEGDLLGLLQQLGAAP
jgi:predicted ester cyclase